MDFYRAGVHRLASASQRARPSFRHAVVRRAYSASIPIDVRVIRFALAGVIGLAALASERLAVAQTPLHRLIDQRISELHPGPEIDLCGDGEFLRRIYLDLVGSIPTAEQARKFIDDPSPNKRQSIVDQLLSDPAHAEHMAHVFDLMLMERRPDKYVKSEAWSSYLLTSFQQAKPFNHMARDVLAADGADEAERGPAKFYLEREVEPNLLTREVGRVFFGMDLQCAQCHDHPDIDDYHQSDYYGLFAFLNRSYLFQPDKKKPAVLAEKAEGDAKFKSVFTNLEGETQPRLPGSTEIDEPTFGKDDAYEVKPDPKKKAVRPIPKYSRRKELARRATDGSNRAFNRAIANRLWALMMGRGLVEPVDQHHSDNPAAHPELLDLLADELVKHEFSVKAMVRAIALSRTYQRRIDLPADLSSHVTEAKRQLEHWTQKHRSLQDLVAQSESQAEKLEHELTAAKEDLPALEAEVKKAAEAFAAASKALADAEKVLTGQQQQLTHQESIVKLLSASINKATDAAKLLADDASLKPALTTLTTQQDRTRSTVDQLQQEVEKLSKVQQAAVRTMTAAQQALTVAENHQLEKTQSVAELSAQVAKAQQTYRWNRTEFSHATQQISRLQRVITYGNRLQQRDTLKAESKQLAERIEESRAVVSKWQPAAEKLTAAEKQLSDAKQQAATAKERWMQLSQASELITTSLDQLRQAAALVAEKDELQSVVEQLTPQQERLAEQVAAANQRVIATGQQQQTLENRTTSLRQLLEKAQLDLEVAKKDLAGLPEQQAAKQRQLESLEEPLAAARQELTSAWSQQFSLAVIQPLSPEQLAWSMLKATGEMQRQRANVRQALNNKSPLKPEELEDPKRVAAREKEIEQQSLQKLSGVVSRLVKLFAAAAGQPQDDFFATVDQALFLSNGGEVRGWLSPANGNLTDRLRKMDDPKALAEELYLNILTRMPTDRETADVADYLSSEEKDKSAAIQQMAWALLSSAEFRFHH